MRRIGVWFVLLNKRLFKKYSFLLILCLVPLLVGGLRMAAGEERGIVTIALATENPEDPLSIQVLEELKEDNGVLRYVMCDTPREARELVTSGRADAAWIFPENLEVSLRAAAAVKKVVPVVTVVERGDTVSLIFAREVLCSALYPYFSYAVYEDYVRDDLGIDTNAQELEEAYMATLVEGNLFQLEYMDGQVAEEGDYLLAPVRGILALWLVLCGFAASMYFLQDEKEGFFSRTPEKHRIWASFAVHGILLLDAAIVLLGACALAGVFTLLSRELLSAALFVLCVLAFCNLVRLLCGTVERLGVCIPILLAGMAVLCPVFLNIGGWRAVKYLLPPYYYLMSIHRTEYLWGMAFYACVTAALCVCVDWWKRRRTFTTGIVLLLILAAGGIGMGVSLSSGSYKDREKLESADGSYEQGMTESAPEVYGEVEYYLTQSDSYLESGNLSEALQVLEEGYEDIGAEQLAEQKAYLLENLIVLKASTYRDGELRYVSEYDQEGNQIRSVEQGWGVEERTYTYDREGHRTSESYVWHDPHGSLIKWTESEYDDNGRLVSYREGYDGEQTDSWYWHEYDMDDRLLLEEGERKGVSYRYEYEYDENDNLILTNYFSDEDTWRVEYQYDESNNLILKIQYNEEGEGSILYRREQFHDEAGNEMIVDQYYHDGNMSNRVEKTYDRDGNCIRRNDYNSSGELIHWEDEEYDEDGNMISRWSYKDIEGDHSIYGEEYEYDNAGRRTASTYYEGDTYYDELWIRKRYEWEYDRDGNVILYRYYDYEVYDFGPKLSYQAEYSYNEAGQRVSGILYDVNGNMSREEYFYNQEGKESGYYCYDASGNLTNWREYDPLGHIISRREDKYTITTVYEYGFAHGQ